MPQKVDLTVATNPVGLKVKVEGVDKVGPSTITSWVGWQIRSKQHRRKQRFPEISTRSIVVGYRRRGPHHHHAVVPGHLYRDVPISIKPELRSGCGLASPRSFTE